MNKILLSVLICSSFVFAKERTSYEHVYVDHSEPVYEYRSNRHHDNYDRNDRYNNRNNKHDNRYRNNYRQDDQSNQYNNNRSHNSNTNTIGLDTIVGGTLGVIIGNQVGKGNGRTAAKIVGGVLGAAIANNSRDSRYQSDFQDNRTRYYKNRKSRIIVGYKNFFRYEGRKHFKITNRPKKRIRITKTISF